VPAKVITHWFVESVRPRSARTEYPDAGCPGLYLVVQSSGTKSWAVRFRHEGVNGKKTLGRAGEDGLSIAAARAAAAAHRHRLERGVVTPVTSVTSESGGGSDKIEIAVAKFFELHVRRKTRASTARATEGIFNQIILPAWRGRTVGSIRKRDVIELVESVAARGRGYRANRTQGALSKFFNWLVARDVLAFSPVTGVERPHKEERRTRILNDAELCGVWLACADEGPSGKALRLAVLTGTRRSESSELLESEIDEDERLWRLPAARAKNGQACNIPLSSQAWELIKACPRFAGCPFIFTIDGNRPVNDWDAVKRRISAKAGIAVDSWRLHDLRRTVASGMQRLGVRTEAIERALNHSGGLYRGIVGVYQADPLEDEVRIALQKWADRVDEIVGGKPAKIFTLRGKRG
jgi:integrase